MADWTNINSLVAKPVSAPTTNTANAGGDRFQAAAGARYLVIFNNAGGTPVNTTIDDPNTQAPLGAETFNPDIVVAVTNAQRRAITVDGSRHRDVNGWVNITYSASPTMTAEIYGPL